MFCRSDKYEDELTWGAAWLYRVTNDTKYLTWAEQYYITGPDWGQSWDDKYSGNMVIIQLDDRNSGPQKACGKSSSYTKGIVTHKVAKGPE